MRYKVLLVDDHEVVRQGIRRLIEGESQFTVCGEASNGKEAVEKAATLKPNVVLMDLSMPVMGGIEAARHIRHLSPVTKIVILSLHDSSQVEQQAKKAGADAFVCKSQSADVLIQTILGLLGEERGEYEEHQAAARRV
jgi:DNA-binding NarL/FixJ family response regulator